MQSIVPQGGNALHLGNAGAVQLGRIDAGPERAQQAVDELVQRRISVVTGRAEGDEQLLYEQLPLALADYIATIRRIDSLRNARMSGRAIYESPAVLWLIDNFNRTQFTEDLKGWFSYLSAKHPAFFERLATVPPPVLEEDVRKRHTLIAGPNGWGKSELLKAIVHHHVRNDDAAVVVIDPHGDMVRQIARWPELAGDNRLVFLARHLEHPNRVASLNPLDTVPASTDLGNMLAEQLAGAMSEMMPASELTPRMHTAVKNCARVLLDRPGASLVDLRHMMKDCEHPKAKELTLLGQRHHDEEIAEYFSDKFPLDQMTVSKSGIWDRLDGLLGDTGFKRWFCQPSTVDLAAAVEARKVILLDLSDLTGDARKTGGRLTLAMLAGIGFQRLADSRLARTPVHVVVDEANHLVGPSILTILQEMRKAGIHLTMSQQVEGTGFSSEAKASLFRNTAIKFMGGQLSSEMANLMNIPKQGVEPLQPRQFWGLWGTLEPFRLTVREDLADHHEKTPHGAWEAVLRRQLSTYYREPPPRLAPPAAGQNTPSRPNNRFELE